jgi:hypothetical protein
MEIAFMLNEKFAKAKSTIHAGKGDTKYHMPSLGHRHDGTLITKVNICSDRLINLELLDGQRCDLREPHLQMWVQCKRAIINNLERPDIDCLTEYVKNLRGNFTYMADFANRQLFFSKVQGLDWASVEQKRRLRSIAEQERNQAEKGFRKGEDRGRKGYKGKGGPPPRTDVSYDENEDVVFTAGRRTSFIKMCQYYIRDHRIGEANKGCNFYDTCTFLHAHRLTDPDVRGLGGHRAKQSS